MAERLTFGIQGGKGSFNEKALQYYVEKEEIENYEVNYLYTTENVLTSLDASQINIGQFAIYNSLGGIVDESLYAMAKHNFKILDRFAIEIAHALMVRPDANILEITTIMTHPQVLAQCVSTLAKKYPHLEKTSGEGNLIDHSEVARYLHEKKLPKTTAVMGSNILAKIYELVIVEDNLQDNKNNFTNFLVVAKYEE